MADNLRQTRYARPGRSRRRGGSWLLLAGVLAVVLGVGWFVLAPAGTPPPAIAAAPHASRLLPNVSGDPLGPLPGCDGEVTIPAILLFDLDSARLRPEAGATLRDWASAHQCGDRPITVSGYADGLGDDNPGYLLDLSRQRASAVADALVDGGLERARITVRGHGAEGAPPHIAAPEFRRVIIRIG
ncbi:MULTISPECIES: OmpA family protein [Pseudofrankia]|uniref:OmpA family protein n=1 Tax=Pseudofrankia TaxID=2994363 RepID=UPI000234B6B0|nr:MULTISPECIES: OmpA family protein [Pseudofrankia]OHV35966.1 hypothetical protein BCD49_20325 [Pseudofrankia sp. EUN1h]